MHPRPVVTPIIHLNGDRKDTLMQNLDHAYVAVFDAMTVLARIAPNARNYYPETGRYEKAIAQHYVRLAALKAVYESLEQEMNQIDEETR